MTNQRRNLPDGNSTDVLDNPAHTVPVRLAADWLQSRGIERIDGALVLGSGWAPLINHIEVAARWSYNDIAGIPECSVAGHPGDLVFGTWADTQIMVFVGRWHAYEGRTPAELSLPALLAKELDAQWLLCTNAAGGVDPQLEVGELVAVTDDLGTWSSRYLTGGASHRSMPRHDGTYYSRELTDALLMASRHAKVPLRAGSLAMMPGANYESSAEIVMLRKAGASVVTMSTVPEARAAQAVDLPVAAISCVTNRAPSSVVAPLDHKQVLETLEQSRDGAARLIEAWLGLI